MFGPVEVISLRAARRFLVMQAWGMGKSSVSFFFFLVPLLFGWLGRDGIGCVGFSTKIGADRCRCLVRVS